VRLPLRHPPPAAPEPRRTCAYLDALAGASLGLPLGPGAQTSSPRHRGRYGAALQWHLGLERHDGQARLDWEDRIEVKLVSVWRRGTAVVCDKLKVCDVGIDPWHKLANVLWVFADRTTRVVVGHRQWHLEGALLTDLARAWTMDPNFERAPLFVESRDARDGRGQPAYYLDGAWLRGRGLFDELGPGVLAFDAGHWQRVRRRTGHDPAVHVVGERDEGGRACGRCGATLRWDPQLLAETGWAPVHHGVNGGAEAGALARAAPASAVLAADAGEPRSTRLQPTCIALDHIAVRAAELLGAPRASATGGELATRAWPGAAAPGFAAMVAAIEGHAAAGFRLCEWVDEPLDHRHELEPRQQPR
jgi:hypothetical protein